MPHVILRFRLPDEQVELNAAMQGRDAKGGDLERRSILP
jgi:hypothetical protein